MLSYKDFTKHFGTGLYNEELQTFLNNTFSDLSEYDILKSEYITSENTGIELGFINDEAVYDEDDNIVFEKGNPILSHFNLYNNSLTIIDKFPFEVNFNDKRTEVLKKAGNPNNTSES